MEVGERYSDNRAGRESVQLDTQFASLDDTLGPCLNLMTFLYENSNNRNRKMTVAKLGVRPLTSHPFPDIRILREDS